jgi:hypothetical protein
MISGTIIHWKACDDSIVDGWMDGWMNESPTELMSDFTLVVYPVKQQVYVGWISWMPSR